MNNMLRDVLKELLNIKEEILGLIYDLLLKLIHDRDGEFLKKFKLFLRGELIGQFCNMITRHVKVDRKQKPHDALKATGRNLYVSDDVVETMPKGEGEEADVIFFKPEPWEYTRPGWISDDDVEKCLKHRNLKPADPYSLAKANEDDPAFAETHPNGTQWKDAEGKQCFATFDRYGGGRGVRVGRDDGGWGGGWWFGGLRIDTQSSVPQVS